MTPLTPSASQDRSSETSLAGLIEELSAKIEAGEVLLPSGAKWLKEFRTEVLAFPHGSYDDQIDSMSQALSYMSRRPTIIAISA